MTLVVLPVLAAVADLELKRLRDGDPMAALRFALTLIVMNSVIVGAIRGVAAGPPHPPGCRCAVPS